MKKSVILIIIVILLLVSIFHIIPKYTGYFEAEVNNYLENKEK